MCGTVDINTEATNRIAALMIVTAVTADNHVDVDWRQTRNGQRCYSCKTNVCEGGLSSLTIEQTGSGQQKIVTGWDLLDGDLS